MPRKTKLGALAAVVAAMLPLSACGGDPTSGGGTGRLRPRPSPSGRPTSPRTSCSPRCTPRPWRPRASRSTRKFNIGARELYLKALKDGSIDMIPEYNGALLAALSPGGTCPQDVSTPTRSTTRCRRCCPSGTRDAAAVRRRGQGHPDGHLATPPSKYNLKTIDDLKPVAEQAGAGRRSGVQDPLPGRGRPQEGLRHDVQVVQAARPGRPAHQGGAEEGRDPGRQHLLHRLHDRRPTSWWCSTTPKNLFLAQNIMPVIAQVQGQRRRRVDASTRCRRR